MSDEELEALLQKVARNHHRMDLIGTIGDTCRTCSAIPHRKWQVVTIAQAWAIVTTCHLRCGIAEHVRHVSPMVPMRSIRW